MKLIRQAIRDMDIVDNKSEQILSQSNGAVVQSVIAWPDNSVHDDLVAEEVAVALCYNGISYAVMMASPMDLEPFALGFSFTEGIISGLEDVFDCEIQPVENGIEINLNISQRCFNALRDRRRNLTGKTGCGVCGLESLKMLDRGLQPVVSAANFTPEAIQCAVISLSDRQTLQALTGAVHAAVWCDSQGNILYIAEDVGRHNALDKLIGKILKNKVDRHNGFIFVSSRLSYEMSQKAIAIGAPMLVGASAAVSKALSEAEKYGLCLVGFARPGRHLIYTHSYRIQNTL